MKNNKKDFIYSKNPKNSMRVEKQKKPKKNKTAMIILWLLFAFWTLGTVLSLFTFSKDLIEVKADSVTELYTFEGSNITVWGRSVNFYNLHSYKDFTLVDYNSDLRQPQIYPVLLENNFLITYRFTLSDIQWDINGATYYTEMILNTSYNQYDNNRLIANPYGGNTYQPESIDDNSYRIILGSDSLVNYYCIYSTLGPRNFLRITRSSASFVCNIVRVDMGNFEDTLEPRYYIESGSLVKYYELTTFNYIRYFDINGNYLEIAIPVNASKSYQPQAYLSNRSYYLVNNFSNSPIYQVALQEGFNEGSSFGYSDGVRDGFNQGSDVGFNNGYKDGLVDSTEYTFLGLIGSLIDAPIRVFFGDKDEYGQYKAGLLSFDILGVNLINLFSGILTISLIVFVLRITFGKG